MRDSSGFAIDGVQVSCPGGTGISGTNGFYKIVATAGTYTVQFSASGYVTRDVHSITVNDNEVSTLSVSLDTSSLAPLVIDSVYPTLGRLYQTMQVSVHGNSFDGNTRVAMMPDYGNANNIVSSANTWGNTKAVAVSGHLAYVADGDNGFLVVDISDPNGIDIISFKGTANKSLVFGDISDPYPALNIAVDDSRPYAYVAAYNGGLQVVDISNPEAPFAVGDLPASLAAYDVAVEGNWAYVADGSNGLIVVDITDPTSPVEEGRLALASGKAQGVAVNGNKVYLGGDDNRFLVVDVTDHAQPVIIGSDNTATLSTSSQITVEGNTAYVVDGGLLVYDVSVPANPILKSHTATTGNAVDIAVDDSTAYIAVWDGGLEIVDVSDHAKPVSLGSVSTPTDATGVAITGNVAYVTDWQQGLQAINVSAYTKPTIMGYYAPGMPRDIVVQGTTAYVVDVTTGLVVYDISDPAAPVMMGSEFVSNPMALTVVGNYAYVADGFGGLKVIDVSDPTDPTTVGSEWIDGTQGFAQGVHVANNIVYLAVSDKGLHLINVSDPTDPYTVHVEDTFGTAYAVTTVNNTAYVADHSYGLQVIDVTNPANPVLKGSVNTGGQAWDVVVSGDYAYVANKDTGLKVINVSNPDSPVETGSVSSGDLNNARGVKLVGNTAYVSSTGLVAIDVSTKSSPVVIGLVDLSHGTYSLDVAGQTAHLVDWQGGITIVALPVELTNFSLISPTEMSVSLPSPPGAGNYIIRVFDNSEADELSGAVTFTDDLRLLTSKAIIVAGGGPEATGDIWTETRAYANYAYENLLYQGYLNEDIYYLTDEAGAAGRDAAATKNNLQYAITSWAGNSIGDGDLLMYFVDHGANEVFQIRGGAGGENVSAQELYSWLDTLQGDVPGNVIFIYDACKSGSFISSTPAPRKTLDSFELGGTQSGDQLQGGNKTTNGVTSHDEGKVEAPERILHSSAAGDAFFPAIFLLLKGGPGERIVITSSRPDEVAYFLDPTHSFSYHFWSTLSGKSGTKASLADAFEEASSSMSLYQTAQLDANGNGIPNEAQDFTDLEDIEGTIYALRRQYTGSLSKPVIGVFSDNQTLIGTNTASFMARNVYDMDGDEIVRVWAEIIRPDFNPHQAGVTVTDIPTVELTGPDADGVYEGSYSNCDIEGTYIVKFFAKDAHGIVSEPKLSLVSK